MRVLIAVLVLIFSLQSWTKADDIRDFQIEGMSVGDSSTKAIFYKLNSGDLIVVTGESWIEKKEKIPWIEKKEKTPWITKKTQWISLKNSNNDLVFISLLPLAFLILYMKRNL